MKKYQSKDNKNHQNLEQYLQKSQNFVHMDVQFIQNNLQSLKNVCEECKDKLSVIVSKQVFVYLLGQSINSIKQDRVISKLLISTFDKDLFKKYINEFGPERANLYQNLLSIFQFQSCTIDLLKKIQGLSLLQDIEKIKELTDRLQSQKLKGYINPVLDKWKVEKTDYSKNNERFCSMKSKFFNLASLINREYQQQNGPQFSDIREDNEIDNQLHCIQEWMDQYSSVFKNADFYNKIVDNLKDFMTKLKQPLQVIDKQERDIIFIIDNKIDVSQEFNRILEKFKEFILIKQDQSRSLTLQLTEKSRADSQVQLQAKKEISNLMVKIKILEKQNEKFKEQLQSVLQDVEQEKKNNEKKLVEMKGKIIRCKSNIRIMAQNILTINSELFSSKHQLIQSTKFINQQTQNILNIVTNNDYKHSLLQSQIQRMSKLIIGQLQQTDNLKIRLAQVENNLKTNDFLLKQTQQAKLCKQKQMEGVYLSRDMAESSLKKVENDLQSLQVQYSLLNAQNQRLIGDLKIRDFNQFFPNEILFDKPLSKKFIASTLESRFKCNIKATKLLYRFESINKSNFHRYVDGHPNLLLLIELRNGRIIAGFSNKQFEPGCHGDDGILMVINTQKVFYRKEGAKVISYDDYYLIFGNSEIRLKAGQQLIFSNFGIANSYFDCNKNSVDALLGEGKDKRELPIKGYEIYQVHFDNQ